MVSTPKARELLELSSSELARRVAAGLPGTPSKWVESLREEAGRFYHTDASQARRISRRAVELAELLGEPFALGWGHRALAEALLFSGRMREADQSYARAAAAWRKARAHQLLGQLLVGRIHVLSLLSRQAEAETCVREARRYLEAAGDRAYLAKLAMNLGNLHFQRDQYGPALREYERAAALFRQLRVRDRSVLGLETNRAVALTHLDRDESALALFRRLERECGRRGYDLLRAQIRMNAAYVHSQRAEFDLALQELSRATAYFRETEHPSFLASCELNRAEIYHQLNLHRDALDLTEQAVPRFEREGLGYDAGLALSQGALSSLVLGDLPEAFRKIRKGQSLFARAANPGRVALMQMLWAEALNRRGRYREAESRAAEASAIFRRLGLLRWEATAAILLGKLESRRLPPAARLPRLRRLLRRVPERIYPIPAYRLLEALGEAQEQAGRRRQAANTYQLALRRLEDVRVRIPTEDSRIAFLQDKTHLYDRLLALELQERRPSVQQLFALMERSRAQSMWDRLRSPSAYLDPALPEEAGGGGRMTSARVQSERRLSELRRHLSWLHTRLSRVELGSPEERSQAPALRQRLSEAEASWSRLLREHAEAGAGRTSRSHGRSGRPRADRERKVNGAETGAPGSVPTIDEVAGLLPAGWGFLSYHIGPDFSLAMAITREGAVWRQLASDLGARLTRLADRLDFQWGAAALCSARQDLRSPTSTPLLIPPSGTDLWAGEGDPRIDQGPVSNSTQMRLLQATTDGVLAELHTLLWEPLKDLNLSPWLRWVVSGHGPVHRIPLHALLGPSGYLIEQTDLCLTPSARIWRALPNPGRAQKPIAWVAGVPSPQLPAVEREVDQVCRHLRGWAVTRELSPTRDALRREGRRSRLLHVAAHGSLRRDNPAYSFVELADGPLFVYDLASFRLPASTVVLSACSSGRGVAPAGDEWIGLGRGFLQAGASAVVASLWPIQDEPTLELMDRFYASLLSGTSVPEAMGEAMRQLLPRRPHPWHWASFAVLGGAGRVASGNRKSLLPVERPVERPSRSSSGPRPPSSGTKKRRASGTS